MTGRLPLEVLGLVGPVLSWVEGTEGVRLPQRWRPQNLPLEEREQAWLVRELPTYSYDTVDEIVSLSRRRREAQVRPHPWRPRQARDSVDPPEGWEMTDVFGRLGQRYFRWNGTAVVVRRQLLEEVHELALRFPMAHVLRHVHARALVSGTLKEYQALGLTEQLANLGISSRSLETVVGRGVTEGHLHLWGVTSAEETWADHLLQSLSPVALRGFTLEARRLLVLSRYAVKILALGVLQAELQIACPRDLVPLLHHLDRLYLARGPVEVRDARRQLRAALHRALDIDWPGIRQARIQRASWLLRLIDPALDRIRRRSSPRGPGHPAFPGTEGIRDRVALLERLHFAVQHHLLQLWEGPPALHRGRRRLASGSGEAARRDLGDYLHRCFYRYLILQTHHWQLGTQSGQTTGLDQFKRFYDARQREAMDDKGLDIQGWILERLRVSPHLHTVEGRLTPPKRGAADYIPWVLGYAHGARHGELDRFGLVVHFIKDEKEPHSAPIGRRNARTVRKGQARRKARRTAYRLFRLLSTPHPVTPFLVGIDAANLELTTPPEVFAPAFRFLRDLPIEVQRSPLVLDRFRVDREIRSLLAERQLGLTYHVWEDFRHLLSGLRAISEVIYFLNPRPGDRLGHAIALGVEPEAWVRQMGHQVVLPKLEALDSLVWIHHILGPGDLLVGELEVEDWIQRLSWEVYGPASRARGEGHGIEGWAPLALWDAWMLRQLDPYSMDLEALMDGEGKLRNERAVGPLQERWLRTQRAILQRYRGRVGSAGAYRLLAWYWYDAGVRRRGAETMTVELGPEGSRTWNRWLEVFHKAQARMLDVVSRRQLVVEVNPSSNRLVGPLEGYRDHPVFRLTWDAERKRQERKVRVTVNTDDPGVFNTSLAHEYYLLGEILLGDGIPETEVSDWLEWLRVNGNDYTFLRSLPPAKDPRVVRVLETLERSCQPMVQRLGGRKALDRFWSWLRTDPGEKQERWANLSRREVYSQGDGSVDA